MFHSSSRSIWRHAIWIGVVFALASAALQSAALAEAISDRPDTYGVYIYSQGRFTPLEKTRIRHTNTWYPITYSDSRVGVCHLPELENALEISAKFQKDDLLCIYFPEAAEHRWHIATLFRFPEFSFRGRASHDIYRRPEGWYAGFIAMGEREDLMNLLGGKYVDNYHFERKSIKDEDIVHKAKDILFARLEPDETLPVAKYVVTAKDYTYDKGAGRREIDEALPQTGYLLEFPHITETKFFQARHDLITRYNESRSKRYLVTHKEFVLTPDEVINTGIFVDTRCRIRFRSTDDFRLATAPGEWGEKAYWPSGFSFARDYIRVRESEMKAHLVEHRNFSLRYEKTEAGTEIRLMGMKSGSKVMVIYSPMFAHDRDYEDHVEAGWNFFRQKRYAAAEGEFKTALEKLPEYPKALDALAWLYANAEDPEYKNPKEALKLSLQALKFRPRRPYVFDAVSAAYFVNGDLENAIEFQEKAYGQWSNPPRSYVEKMALYRSLRAHKVDASKYFEQGKYVEAIKELQAVLEEMPNYFDALNLFAMILATAKDPRVNNPATAMEYAKAALALAPEKDYILDTVAECLFALGDKKNALRFARKALYYDLGNEHYQTQVKRFSQ